MHKSSQRQIETSPFQSEKTQWITDFLIAWGPLVILSLTIYWFSSRPGFGQPHAFQQIWLSWFGETTWYIRHHNTILMIDAYSAELAHFTEYALLALVNLWAVTRQWPHLPNPWLPAFAYPAYFALTDEIHQYFVPGRHCDWRDVLMDWFGAAFALGVAYLLWQQIVRYQRRRYETQATNR